MGIRDLVKSLSPAFLIGPFRQGVAMPDAVGVGERMMYVFGLGCDILVEKALEGARFCFPNVVNASSLPLVGDDRGIVRGLSETDEGYAVRLRRWLDTWRHAGAARGVLESIAGYVNVAPKIESILEAPGQSVWDVIEEGVDPTLAPVTTHVSPANWAWDALGYPRRRWLVIRDKNDATGQAWVTTGRTWGDGTKWGEAGVTWGGSLAQGAAASMAKIISDFKSAATRYWWVIVNFNAARFSAALPAGDANNPNSSFANWSKIDTSGVRPVRVRSRFTDARYFQGPLE